MDHPVDIPRKQRHNFKYPISDLSSCSFTSRVAHSVLRISNDILAAHRELIYDSCILHTLCLPALDVVEIMIVLTPQQTSLSSALPWLTSLG